MLQIVGTKPEVLAEFLSRLRPRPIKKARTHHEQEEAETEGSLKTASTLSIHDLPTEMLDIILKSLDFFWKPEARLVCKQWKELIDKTVKFRPVLCSDTCKYVSNCKQDVQELVVVNFAANNRIPLNMHDVKKLTLGAGLPFVNISRFLKLNPENITSLTLDHLALSSRAFRGEFLATLNMACLSELKLVVLADPPMQLYYPRHMKYINHVDGLIRVLNHLQTPRLKTLKGEFYASSHFSPSKPTDLLLLNLMRYLLISFVKFATMHHESLSGLNLEFTSPKPFPQPDPDMNVQDLSKLRLQSLELKPDVHHLGDMVKIVTSVTGLKRLKLERNFVHFPSDGEEFEEVIKAHSKTLEHLNIGLVVFKSNWIAACHQLKTLSLETISHARQACEFTSMCLPTMEELHLRYFHDNEEGPKNDLLFWLRNSFPNLKSLVMEFALSYISTHFIKLLLGLKKLDTIIVIQRRPPSDDNDIDWDFEAFCKAVPGVILHMMDLPDGRSVFYDFRIMRTDALNKLYQNLFQ